MIDARPVAAYKEGNAGETNSQIEKKLRKDVILLECEDMKWVGTGLCVECMACMDSIYKCSNSSCKRNNDVSPVDVAFTILCCSSPVRKISNRH